jgi:hypothetical protein
MNYQEPSMALILNKDILRYIFCLTLVAQDSQSDFQDEPVKTIKQNRQGIRVSLAKLFHYVFVSHVGHGHDRNAEGGSRRFWDNRLVMHARCNPLSSQYAGD